jgi:cystathionine beta-lyase
VDDPLLAPTLGMLRRRRSLKWRLYGQDVLPLWVAEMDVLPAQPVTRAVSQALAIGDTGYSWPQDYVDALGEFSRDRWGWEPDQRGSRIVPDVMLGIVEVLRLVTDPGDAVVVNSPVYPPFYSFIRHAGRRVVEAPLSPSGRIDVDTLARALQKATGGGRSAAYLLCSPHNPTGAVHTPGELTAAGELAAAHGARVVVDEIHAPLVYAGRRFTPYLSLPVGATAFSLMSASKGWNLAGLKAALALAGPEAVADLARMPEEAGHGASHLGVVAHAAALRDGGPWLDALLAGLDDNRRLLADLLAEHLPAVRYRAPEGTYLAWLDCRELALGEDPARVFLQLGSVALSGGVRFGTGGAGHARLNLATSPEILREAVDRMAQAVQAG